jgi:hypothetical protein
MKAWPKLCASVLGGAFFLTLVASPCSRVSLAQQEEAAPPSYPHEDNFVLPRRTTEESSESVFKLSDGDVIRVKRRPTRWRPTRTESELPPMKIRFVLDTAPQVKWWKGLTVYQNELPTRYNPRGVWLKLGHVFVEDRYSHGRSLEIHVNQLRGGVVLVFEKAKAFGAHTPMHGMLLTEAEGHLAGETIYFTWEKDQ